MKILHTADWHLGQRFYDRSRIEEHRQFFDFLLEYIKTEQIDLLLVAGDVFDTANPSHEANALYHKLLFQLHSMHNCQIVIIAGNHDSPSHLSTAHEFLRECNIHVVSVLPENPTDALIEIKKEQGETLHIAAIPYLRDRDLRTATRGENIEDREESLREGIRQCYWQMAEHASSCKPLIATGHLTALGSRKSDSERAIHIGNLGSISSEDFPESFAYVALGHLHRPQAVGDRMRYSGSPIPLSFSELDVQKEMRLITVDGEELKHESVPLPCFRRLIRLQGNVDELHAQLRTLAVEDGELTPWIELTLSESSITSHQQDEYRSIAADRKAEILKIGLEKTGIPSLDMEGEHIQELQAEEVFQKRLEEYKGSIEKSQLTACFRELLMKDDELQRQRTAE